jgi:hypothetical protein
MREMGRMGIQEIEIREKPCINMDTSTYQSADGG